MKPIIGISCNTLFFERGQVDPAAVAKGQDFFGLAVDYVRMIEKAGGTAVVLPSTSDLKGAEAVWAKLDGILISGGNDIDPRLYSCRIKKDCGNIDVLRDSYESAAIRYALKYGKPLLCICRGMQLLNAVLGGTLHQDLLSVGFEQHSVRVLRRGDAAHTVNIVGGSALAGIVGAMELGVNSFHHQSVDRLSDVLRAVAISEDGVIEAAELSDGGDSFMLAVQWHPEMMLAEGAAVAEYAEAQLKIAEAFVRACSFCPA